MLPWRRIGWCVGPDTVPERVVASILDSKLDAGAFLNV